jgi:hypothetical protein
MPALRSAGAPRLTPNRGPLLPKCKRGEMVPKVGFSQTKQRMWAAYMCPERHRECIPLWVPDRDVYHCWLESVGANGANKVLYGGDVPPF